MLKLIPQPESITLKSGILRLSGSDFRSFTVRKTESMLPEEYRIEVDSEKITVFCSGDAGYFYAEKTLEQAVFQCGQALPCMIIKDFPRFPFRSFMIDCSRHFFTVDELKILIDTASHFKYNKFHWHLSDDQGWRAEIPSLPSLAKKGSVRPFSSFGNVKDMKPYGGYYTVDEMKDIVSYCRERFIDVIPEIEMPGHVTALLSVFPEISCTGNAIEPKTTSGIFKDILCAGKDKTFDIVFEILDSLCEIFDGEYFHIGGDEAPKKRWESCPDCSARLHELKLDNFEELQGVFVNNIAEHLRKKGKKVISWNESLRGNNLNDDIAVQFWMDKTDFSVKRANSGGKLIVSDFYHYYLDYPYGMTPLKKTYSYNPIMNGLTFGGAENVIGIDTPIWTEHVRDFNRLCYMYFPRMIAVAERAWTLDIRCNYSSFRERLARILPMLDKSIHYAPENVWDISPAARLKNTVSFFARSINGENIKNFLN